MGGREGGGLHGLLLEELVGLQSIREVEWKVTGGGGGVKLHNPSAVLSELPPPLQRFVSDVQTHTHAHKNTSQERAPSPPQPFLLCAICYDTFSSCSHLRRRASQSKVGGASSVLSVNETQNVLIDDGLKCERGALGGKGGAGGGLGRSLSQGAGSIDW